MQSLAGSGLDASVLPADGNPSAATYGRVSVLIASEFGTLPNPCSYSLPSMSMVAIPTLSDALSSGSLSMSAQIAVAAVG